MKLTTVTSMCSLKDEVLVMFLAHRLKLFLEQFCIKSCVLNSELPHNSRYVLDKHYEALGVAVLIAIRLVGDASGPHFLLCPTLPPMTHTSPYDPHFPL